MKALKCPKCEQFMFSSTFESEKINCIYCFTTSHVKEENIFMAKEAEKRKAQNKKKLIVDRRLVGIN